MDLDELKRLSQDGRHLCTTIAGALDIVTRPEMGEGTRILPENLDPFVQNYMK